MADTKIPIPHAVSWSLVSSALVFIATAIWVGRGLYGELQAVRESGAQTASELRSANDRITVLERAINRNDVQMEWVIRALERQERRSGYTPPPRPVTGELP